MCVLYESKATEEEAAQCSRMSITDKISRNADSIKNRPHWKLSAPDPDSPHFKARNNHKNSTISYFKTAKSPLAVASGDFLSCFKWILIVHLMPFSHSETFYLLTTVDSIQCLHLYFSLLEAHLMLCSLGQQSQVQVGSP